MSTKPDDTLTIQVSRDQLIVIAIPVAFLLGLALGYFSWGRTAIATEQVAQQPEIVADESAQSAAPAQSGDQAVVDPPTVAEQIENLDRYEVPLDENDPITGPEDAPVTIVEFSDFECPFCQRHFQEVYPRLISTYGDQIRYVFKDFPLTSIHPNAFPAAEAALCSLEQNAFWPFHDLLFGGTQGLSRSSYESYASSLNLDIDAFTLCLDESRYAASVQADQDFGIETGVRSTPTFFINGIGLVGAQPFEVFAQIIDYELENIDPEAE
jgi:protein-disulfide isomerase